MRDRAHTPAECFRLNLPPPPRRPPSLEAAALALDVSPETARAVHRVVRGFHDGECPRCHQLFDSWQVLDPEGGSTCPRCAFTITAQQKQAAMLLFAPHMDKALAVFEAWLRGDADPAAAVPMAPPPPQCRLMAHNTGEGWSLTAEDAHGEVMGYLEWPGWWPESVSAQWLRDRGFTVV